MPDPSAAPAPSPSQPGSPVPLVSPVRIILVDFWASGPKYQRQMLWVILTLFVIVFGAAAVRLLQILITHSL